MPETSPHQFQQELCRIHTLAVKDGWMTFHMADAVDVSIHKVRGWMRGQDVPPTGRERDQVLMMIVNSLGIKPV